jgi:hypothetical protein
VIVSLIKIVVLSLLFFKNKVKKEKTCNTTGQYKKDKIPGYKENKNREESIYKNKDNTYNYK